MPFTNYAHYSKAALPVNKADVDRHCERSEAILFPATNALPSAGFYLTAFGENPKVINGGKIMAYTKPQVIAQNASSGSYAAGCPAQGGGPVTSEGTCRRCERTK